METLRKKSKIQWLLRYSITSIGSKRKMSSELKSREELWLKKSKEKKNCRKRKTMNGKRKTKINFSKNSFKVWKRTNKPTKCQKKTNKKNLNPLSSTITLFRKTAAKSLWKFLWAWKNSLWLKSSKKSSKTLSWKKFKASDLQSCSKEKEAFLTSRPKESTLTSSKNLHGSTNKVSLPTTFKQWPKDLE